MRIGRPARTQVERLVRGTLRDAIPEAPTWGVYDLVDRWVPILVDLVLELLDQEARGWAPKPPGEP